MSALYSLFFLVPADDVFTSAKREKSFACRIKCTMSHGGGFYKVSAVFMVLLYHIMVLEFVKQILFNFVYYFLVVIELVISDVSVSWSYERNSHKETRNR